MIPLFSNTGIKQVCQVLLMELESAKNIYCPVKELYNDIMTTFELQCVTFEKLEYILQIQIIL